MKKISFLLVLFLSSFIFSSPSQEKIVIDDFESGDQGWLPVDSGWVDFEIVDNPHPDDVNSSAKVMKIIRKAGTEAWAGIILRNKMELAFGDSPGEYRYVHVKIFKTTGGRVSFKLEKNGDAGAFRNIQNYSLSEQWQEIVFDMGNATGAMYDDYFIMPDLTENLSDSITIYIDDIELTASEAIVFRPVWADEFNGNTYDSAIWSPQIAGGGFGNNELQYYTGLKKNIFTRDGNLVLKTYKELYQNHGYTSGKLWSKDKKFIKYGRVEARFKLPKGRGTWPAIWMMPQSSVYGEWPHSGEIDMMEFVGYDAGKVYGAVHRSTKWGNNGSEGNASIVETADNFHIIRIDWEPGYIKWYLDGQLFYRYNNAFTGSAQWPFDQEFYVILNFAVGGSWGGAQGIDDNIWPQEFLIDYVRVYQKSEDTAVQPVKNTLFSVYALSKEKLKITSLARLPVHVNIYSLTGEKRISKKAVTGDFTVDISGLSQGIYIITVSDGNDSYSHKIIK